MAKLLVFLLAELFTAATEAFLVRKVSILPTLQPSG